MQFSHSDSLCFAAPTRSGTNELQRFGQSCFKICTSTLLILLMNARSRRNELASVESLMIKLLMKFLMPSRWSSGSAFQRYLITPSITCSAKNLVFGFWLCSRIASARVHISSCSCREVITFSASERCERKKEKREKCQKRRFQFSVTEVAHGEARTAGFHHRLRESVAGLLRSWAWKELRRGCLEEGPAKRSPGSVRARVGERDRARTIVGSAPGV